MTKLEFMKELESLLSDIPLEEREEALNYYSGYIEDAGEEHEEDILKELGSPAKVAGIIKADLNLNATDRESSGIFTENGYKNTIYTEEKFELTGGANKQGGNAQSEQTNSQTNNQANGQANSQQNSQQNTHQSSYNQNASQGSKAQSNANNMGSGTKVLLIILLCFFGFPLIMSAFGIAIGIISAIVGIMIGFGVAGIALFVSGIVLFFTGLAEISVPFVGLVLCGAGLIVFGIGMLFMSLTAWLCKNVIPAIFKGIVNLCKMPFQNRSVIA